jgi:hypothetical protein
VVDGWATFDPGTSAPGDIFDFSLAVGPDATPRRLVFGSPDVVQQRPYRIYSTAHGSFSIMRLPSLRPGQLPDKDFRHAARSRLRRALIRRLPRAVRRFGGRG